VQWDERDTERDAWGMAATMDHVSAELISM
jgi:hypothetical protein